jgi:hypothetical protein
MAEQRSEDSGESTGRSPPAARGRRMGAVEAMPSRRAAEEAEPSRRAGKEAAPSGRAGKEAAPSCRAATARFAAPASGGDGCRRRNAVEVMSSR